MSLSLPPEFESYVQNAVVIGRFQSPAAAIEEALRLLKRRDAEFEKLRASIAEGMAELERGEGIELNDDEAIDRFFDEITEGHDERIAKKGQSEPS